MNNKLILEAVFLLYNPSARITGDSADCKLNVVPLFGQLLTLGFADGQVQFIE